MTLLSTADWLLSASTQTAAGLWSCGGHTRSVQSACVVRCCPESILRNSLCSVILVKTFKISKAFHYVPCKNNQRQEFERNIIESFISESHVFQETKFVSLRIQRWDLAVNLFYVDKMFLLGSLSCYTGLRKSECHQQEFILLFFFFNEGGFFFFWDSLSRTLLKHKWQTVRMLPYGLPSTFLTLLHLDLLVCCTWSGDVGCWTFTC